MPLPPLQGSAPRKMSGCDLRWERRLRITFPRLGVLLDDATGSIGVEECYCMEEGRMTFLALVGADRRKL